ncbi:MAG: ribonuclease PH [Acidobacteriia bacterium]|nr:ribonuclease PH [Terriglobia bacterium]MYK08602.1 ribonuclease PH [Terriglobia bacterium]
MRIDGRRPEQPRQTRIQPGILTTAEGSALIEAGNTKVICSATVENRVPAFLRGAGRGWVTAEYGMLPRSTSTRTPRLGTQGRPSGRTFEIQRLIGRSLRAAVDMEKLGERTITVDCDVIQADGGTRTASITGGWVAMACAVKQLLKFNVISASPLRHYVAAISVGIVDGVPMLDLCYEEDSRADVDMNVVMTSAGEFVELQASAEGNTFDRAQFDAQLLLAEQGIEGLIAAQRDLVAL